MRLRANKRSKHRQRGVAIITVMLMVTLATIAVTAMVTRQRLDIYRAGNRYANVQAKKLVLAGERFAVQQLIIDQKENQRSSSDSFEDNWDNPTPPFPVAGGTVEGCIVDLQGRFNLNNLADIDPTKAQDARAQFERLLDALGISTSKAAAVVDWVDEDVNIVNGDGAEDSYYSQLNPPYLPANRRFTHLSELKLVKGFNEPDDEKDYADLIPHLSVLPESTPLNVNTATPPLMRSLISFVDDTLAENLSRWDDDAWEDYPECGEVVLPGQASIAASGSNGSDIYEEVTAFETEINSGRDKTKPPIFDNTDLVDTKSKYFEVRIDAELGDIKISQFSIVRRNSDDTVTVLQRVRGDNLLQLSD